MLSDTKMLNIIHGKKRYSDFNVRIASSLRTKHFYSSTKNHVDPPIVPSKVLMVHRVKPFKGNPYWEKDILETLGFIEKVRNPALNESSVPSHIGSVSC